MEITADEKRAAENALVAYEAWENTRLSAITRQIPEREIAAYVLGMRHGILSRDGEVQDLLCAADHGIQLVITKTASDPTEYLTTRCEQCVRALRILQQHGYRTHTKGG